MFDLESHGRSQSRNYCDRDGEEVTRGGGEGQRECVSSHRVTQGCETLGPWRAAWCRGRGQPLGVSAEPR